MACAIFVGLAADRSSGGTFPGSNGKIAYVLSLDGNQIHVTNSDGTGDTQLTTQGLNSSPAWSPTGDRIAFQSTRDGNDEIYTMNADGSFQTNVTHSSGSDVEPDFSPDGTKLCFSRAIDGYDIFVINVDGTGLTQLTQFGPEEHRCSWSPDGTKVAYVRNGNQPGIWTVDVAAPHAQKPLSDGLGVDDRPSWTPDGSKIVFDSTRAGTTRVWEMNADGSSPAPVTAGPSDIWASRSPDGAQLVFTRAGVTGSPQVFKAASDGSGATPVTSSTGAKLDPQWQPLGGSPPVANGVPTITGTARVGSTLTAHTAGWTGADTTSFQWLKCSGTCSPIDAATGPTFRVDRHLVGSQLAVREIGTNTSGSTTVESDRTSAVPALAGDGQIFFLRSETLADPNQDLWSTTPDGSVFTPYITDSDSAEQLVAISPEGARAVYGRKPLGQPDSAFELYLDGPGFNTPLTSNNVLDSQPAWSPDGKTIAFASDRGGTTGIFLMNVQTLAVTTLYQGAFPSQTPSFSPDGKRVTFFTCGPGLCRVNVINVDGGGLTTITDGQHNDTDPDWGPEDKIVFVRDIDGFSHQLVVVNPDGSGAVDITANGAYNADPSWSPSGDRIAFVTTAFGRPDFDLATIGAEGGPLARVTQDKRNGFPDWAPLLRFAAPASNATLSGEVSVRIAALSVESARFSYVTAGGATTDLGTDIDPPFGVTFDTSTVPDGPGRIVVDTAGPLENSLPVTIDNQPPDTTITAGPSGSTISTIADFHFTSSEPDSTFFCALDGSGLDNCPTASNGGDTSAFYQSLTGGEHTFQVAAIDASGNQDPTPAQRTWTVTPTPPPSTEGKTTIVSLTNAGALGNNFSAYPSISDDGRLVAFESLATNLTPLGNAEHLQVYARDRSAGVTGLISMGRTEGIAVPGNANSGYAQVSDDGSAVAFQSFASNLDCVPTCLPDTNHWHVYLRAPGADVPILVRVDKPDGGIPNGDAQHPAINRDGSVVAFESLATNLGALDTNEFSDIYVRNADAGLERVSVATVTGTEANGPSFSPAVTPDGRYVAFVSSATNLVPNDVNGVADVFVRDRETGTTTLVSVGPGGVQADGESSDGLPPSISANGRYVAFSSIASNLAPGTVPNTEHVYVRDLVAETTEVVDVSATGNRSNAQSVAASISDDGRYVTFDSAASNLSPLTDDGGQNVFRYDRQTGSVEVVDLNPAGRPSSSSHNGQFGTALSADGRYAAFFSFASDLIGPGKDSNESIDVFVRDFSPPAIPETVTADLVAGAPTVEAGAADVPIADLPLSLALQPSTTSSSPIAQQPVAQQPVAQQPIAQQPIAQQPIAQQPIAQFGLTVSDVAAALGDVSLASIPTTYPGGWPAVQTGTRFEGFPAQSVTLGQLIKSFPKTCNPAVLGSCKAPPPLDGVTTTPRQLVLADLDLSQSRLRNLPLMAFAYGGTLLSQLNPGASTGPDQPALTDWCTAFAGPPINCTNPASLSGQTVMGAALLGAPVAQQPIAQQPIAQQNLAASHMDTLSLRQILAAHSRLGSIQVAALANKAAIVTGGTGSTLADLFAAAPTNIAATATLGTLAANTSLAGFTLGDIAFYGDLKVIDLVNGLPQPNSYTVADLIAIMVSRAALDWESIPADRLAAFGKNPAGLMTWHAGFTLGGSGLGATDVKLTLPSGFRYVPGSAKLKNGTVTTPLPDPASLGNALTFSVTNVEFGAPYTIDVDTYAGFVLGPTQAKLDVLPALGPLAGADTAAVIVTDTFEANDTPAGAAPVAPNTNLQLSYVAQAGDVDYFSVDTQPGDRLSVHLANVSADFDLSIIAPAQTKLRTTGASGPPQQNASIRDGGIDTSNVSDSLEPAPLQDTPVAQQPVAQQPIAQQSVNRGANDEDGAVIAKGGKYLIKIAGYGDASSPTPYALRVTETPPQVDAVCSPRNLPNLPASERGALPVGIPANTNTIFLVDRYRIAQTYTTGDAANVMTALGGLAGQAALGVRGVVEPVESWPGVQALYDAWDQNPCSASRANAVSTALAGIVDSVRQSAPGLKYVVLVGGYDLLPPFVIPDLTRIANETGYASTFAGNQYWGWLATSNILSDEPYYDTDPVDLRDTQFFLGDLVGGRLVETPAQIIGAATRFSNPTVNGRLNRSTALSTGYDFVKDGALAVADAAKTYLPAPSVRTLINDGFAATDLVSALFPATGAASLNSLNGHYDHYRALSAAGSANGTLDVMSTSDVDSHSGALAGDVLFSVGCHAGLPVSDVIVGTTTPSRDWDQALASQGSVWAANTGFGLGDTDTVAFSERLMALFAGNLNGSLSIGEALTRAKQQYYLDRPALSAYDEKSLLEASLFGLPFYNVGAPTTAPAPPTTVPGTTAATTPVASPIAADPVSGIDSAVFSATPDFGTVITGKHGKFYANAGGVDVVNYRPLVPKLTMPATKPGLRAHSPFIETLQSIDEANFDGDFVMPTEDLTALSPEAVFGDAAFPSTLATIVSAKIGTGIQSQLDLGTGQFSTDDTLDNSGVGLMRRFTQITGRVFYGTSGTFAPPTIRSTSATKFGSNVGFVVNVCDSVRTYVLFHDLGTPNAPWTGVNLVLDPGTGSCRWSGGATFVGPEVEYFVQACTTAGDCAQSSNKAKNYDAQNAPLESDPAPGQGRVTIALAGPASAPAGFFTGPVTVDATDSVTGVALTATVDGVPRALPTQVTTDGLHLVTVTAADGGHASRAFLIDRTRPQIVITTPAEGAVYNLGSVVKADFTCLDAGSGIKSCTGTVANGAHISTSQLGDNTFTVTAKDSVGNVTTLTRHYTVAWPFTGFLFPVKNPPVVNIVKGGFYVPLRFSLGGNRSLSIFATGFPKSTAITCPHMTAGTMNDDDEQGNPPLPSVLVYIGFIDQYIYFWKTERSWAGTCRDFDMKLKDGTEHHALFKIF